jgi:hypothetical protein
MEGNCQMKKLYVVLFALILLVPGCGKQPENEVKVSNEPKASVNTVSPSSEPTKASDKDNIADQVCQLLPEGIVNASVLKRTYVYSSTEDEEREQKLEKEFRNVVDKNWDELKKEDGKIGDKNLYEMFYNKDVPFRDNIYSFFDNISGFPLDFGEKMGWSIEKYIELEELYKSAKEKIVEDYNTSLNINKEGAKIEITSDNKPKLIKGVKINFSNKTLKLGNDTFEQIGNKDNEGFSISEDFIHKSFYDGKEIETKYLWYQEIDTDHFNYFAVSKVGDTNQVVLRYIVLDFDKNKYTEEMILIKADK